jgi:hypothetical protein
MSEDKQQPTETEGHLFKHGPEHTEVVTDGASESEKRPPCLDDEDGAQVEGHRLQVAPERAKQRDEQPDVEGHLLRHGAESHAFGTEDAAEAERVRSGIRPDDGPEPADGRVAR